MSRQSLKTIQKANTSALVPDASGFLQRQGINRTEYDTPASAPFNPHEQQADNSGLNSDSRFNHDFSRIPVRSNTSFLIQAKLKIGQPNDRFEQEADRIADQVMRMPAPDPAFNDTELHAKNRPISSNGSIQRTCSACANEYKTVKDEEEELIQAKSMGDTTPEVTPEISSGIQSLQGGGQPLSRSERSFFEPRFGADFSSVRVHHDSQAVNLARSVNARAFTHGNHVIFGGGEYGSDSVDGRKLLAHELVHVVQQNGGRGYYSADKTINKAKLNNNSTLNPISRIAHELTYVLQQRNPQPKTTQIQRQPARAQASPTLEDSQRSWIRAFGLPKFMKGSLRGFRESRELYASFTKNNFKLANDRYLSNVLTASLSTLIVGEEQTNALNGDQAVLQKLRDEYRKLIQFVIPKFASLMGSTPSKVFQAHHSEILDWALPRSSLDPKGGELIDALPDAERQRIQVSTTSHDLGNIEAYFVVRGNIRVTSTGVPVQFASNVPDKLHTGLENIARELVRGSTRPNSNPMRPNQSITLSLNLDRFGGGNAAYRFTYVEHSAGTSGGGRATLEFLVERLGTIGVEGLAANQIVAQQERFYRHAFVRDRTFSSDREFEVVLQGLSQIEDATLAPINGLTFRRERAHPTRPANGLYDPNTHTITLYDSAFFRTQMRVGRPGEGLSSEAIFTVLHEIGHAIDNARTRQNSRPPGAVDASATPEFRSAARRDGNVRITAYAQTDWSEFYAESFALYQSDPTGLQRLRPNLFNYFVRLFPR
ncbi:eCIS core domain-containing protein [Methylomonas sp. MgM2]